MKTPSRVSAASLDKKKEKWSVKWATAIISVVALVSSAATTIYVTNSSNGNAQETARISADYLDRNQERALARTKVDSAYTQYRLTRERAENSILVYAQSLKGDLDAQNYPNRNSTLDADMKSFSEASVALELLAASSRSGISAVLTLTYRLNGFYANIYGIERKKQLGITDGLDQELDNYVDRYFKDQVIAEQVQSLASSAKDLFPSDQ